MESKEAIEALISEAKYLANKTKAPKSQIQKKLAIINSINEELQAHKAIEIEQIKELSKLSKQVQTMQNDIDCLIGILLCLGFTMPIIINLMNRYQTFDDWAEILAQVQRDHQKQASAPYVLLSTITTHELNQSTK